MRHIDTAANTTAVDERRLQKTPRDVLGHSSIVAIVSVIDTHRKCCTSVQHTDQLRASIACAAPVSCISLLGDARFTRVLWGFI